MLNGFLSLISDLTLERFLSSLEAALDLTGFDEDLGRLMAGGRSSSFMGDTAQSSLEELDLYSCSKSSKALEGGLFCLEDLGGTGSDLIGETQ